MDTVRKYFNSTRFDFDSCEIYAHTIRHYVHIDGLDRNCIYVLFNTKDKFHPVTVGAIAHEAIHVVDYIFGIIGAAHDPENPEPFTYLVDYIADLIADFLKKRVGWKLYG